MNFNEFMLALLRSHSMATVWLIYIKNKQLELNSPLGQENKIHPCQDTNKSALSGTGYNLS